MTTCSGTVMLYFVFGPAVQLKYTLQIRCDYSDRKSDVIIQWYRSNIKLCQTYDTTSSPCPGCHIECEENLLTIDAVTKDDSGGYQCVVTKPQSPDEWSRVRYVSVNSGMKLLQHEMVSFNRLYGSFRNNCVKYSYSFKSNCHFCNTHNWYVCT